VSDLGGTSYTENSGMYCGSTTPLPCTVARRPMPGGYVVQGANGRALAYHVLRKDEARRIAVNIARLPELLGKTNREPS
jgi:hypothetical protein